MIPVIPASVIAKMVTLRFSEKQAAAVASMLSEVEAATEADIRTRCDPGETAIALAIARSKNADRQARFRQREVVVTLPDKPVTLPNPPIVTLHNVTERYETLPEPSRAPAFFIGEGVVTPLSGRTTSFLTPQTEKKPKRCTRLGNDWQPSSEMLAFAADAGLTEAEITRQADTIRDWSLSSKTGAKLDWLATWRGWIRRYLAERPKINGHKGGVVEALGRIHDGLSAERPS